MLVKCPRCGNLLEATPGEVGTCKECGFQARAPPAPTPGAPSATPPPPATPPEPRAFLGPLAFLAALAGAGTFYLASLFFPLVLSIAGLVGGIVAYAKGNKDVRGLAAIVVGAIGLALAIVVLFLG